MPVLFCVADVVVAVGKKRCNISTWVSYWLRFT